MVYEFLYCLFTHSLYFFPYLLEPSPAFVQVIGQKVHEVLSRQGCHADFSDDKILEFINSHSLDVSSWTSGHNSNFLLRKCQLDNAHVCFDLLRRTHPLNLSLIWWTRFWKIASKRRMGIFLMYVDNRCKNEFLIRLPTWIPISMLCILPPFFSFL